mgnify:CR=1 FL=1
MNSAIIISALSIVVNVTSAKPTEEFEGKFSTSHESEHGEDQSLLVLSGALSESVLGRLTVSTREMDGWITNTNMKRLEPQRDETYIRGQLAWTSGDVDYNLKVETEEILKRADQDYEKFKVSYDQEIMAKIEKLKNDSANKIEAEKKGMYESLNKEIIDEVLEKAKELVASNADLKNKINSNVIKGL